MSLFLCESEWREEAEGGGRKVSFRGRGSEVARKRDASELELGIDIWEIRDLTLPTTRPGSLHLGGQVESDGSRKAEMSTSLPFHVLTFPSHLFALLCSFDQRTPLFTTPWKESPKLSSTSYNGSFYRPPSRSFVLRRQHLTSLLSHPFPP